MRQCVSHSTDKKRLVIELTLYRFKRVGPNAMKGRGIGTARGRATIMRANGNTCNVLCLIACTKLCLRLSSSPWAWSTSCSWHPTLKYRPSRHPS